MRWLGWCVTPLLIALNALLAIALARGLGPVWGWLVYAALSSAGVGAAAWLLKRSAVGVVGWKNHLAAFLTPLMPFVGGGTLRALVLKHIVAGAVFGLVAILVDRFDLVAPITASGSAGWAGWLAAGTIMCWVVVLGLWLWLVSVQMRHRSEPISRLLMRREPGRMLILPPLVVGASVGLQQMGLMWVALAVVALPLLIVVGPVALMVGVMGIYSLLGKPVRWN
jgi:hypothetical protein